MDWLNQKYRRRRRRRENQDSEIECSDRVKLHIGRQNACSSVTGNFADISATVRMPFNEIVHIMCPIAYGALLPVTIWKMLDAVLPTNDVDDNGLSNTRFQ